MSIYEAIFLTSLVVFFSGSLLMAFEYGIYERWIALIGGCLCALAVVTWPVLAILAIWRNVQ